MVILLLLAKCVLLSTSRAVRREMEEWVLPQEEDEWSVKFDVLDLGGQGFVWSFLVGFLFLLSPWIFMVGFGWSGLCIIRLLVMGLKPLCRPLIAYASFARLFTGWSGLVVSLWLVLVLYLASWMDPLGVGLVQVSLVA